MRLDEEYRRVVVLIGTGEPGSDDAIAPWGTGFIVGDIAAGTFYVVTAWQFVEKNIDAPFDIRFNKKGSGARIQSIESPEWVAHSTDDTVDVAVHEVTIPEWAEASFVPMDRGILAAGRSDRGQKRRAR